VRVGISSSLQEALLPALCVTCDAVLAGDDRGFCGACRSRLVPMSEPCCPVCGVPSDSETDPCLGCVTSPPPQSGTLFWGSYGGILRRAILALKHGGHDELARPLGRRLSATLSLAPWHDEITLVTAVPSHSLRRFRRGVSAAELFAAEVSRDLHRPRTLALRRHGLNRQAGRTRVQRTRLSRGSFSARGRLHGHHVLLVDDVCTTGTTLRRAAECLLLAGAESVFCTVMAHAPDPRRV